MTCSASLSVARRLGSSNPALCLCLITVKHIRRWFLRLVHINARVLCVYVQSHRRKIFFTYVCHIVCFHAALSGSLLFVLICMISTCYPLFMFSPHIHNLLFLAFRLLFFLMLSFYFPAASLLCLL